MITLTQAILYTLGVFIVLLLIKLVNDYIAKNIKHRVIGHKFSAFIDLIVYSITVSYFFNFMLEYNFLIVLLVVIDLSIMRWILFDMAFNLINGDSLMHVGRSSKLDQFLSRFEPVNRFFIKLVPLLLVTGLLIFILL